MSKLVIGLIVSAGVIYILFGIVALSVTIGTAGGNIGMLGDAFGIINALFSGGAFIAVLVTLNLQMQEMKEQRLQFEKMADTQLRALEFERSQSKIQITIEGLGRIERDGFSLNYPEPDAEFVEKVKVVVRLRLSDRSPPCSSFILMTEKFGSTGLILAEAAMAEPSREFWVRIPLLNLTRAGLYRFPKIYAHYTSSIGEDRIALLNIEPRFDRKLTPEELKAESLKSARENKASVSPRLVSIVDLPAVAFEKD